MERRWACVWLIDAWISGFCHCSELGENNVNVKERTCEGLKLLHIDQSDNKFPRSWLMYGHPRAFVYWKLRQFVRHQTAAISHALRRHSPLAPLRESKTQFSNNFLVEDAEIVPNIHRDSSLVATENLFALIIQSYVFEQSMIYLKIISFNIANY